MININDIYTTADRKEFRILWISPEMDTVYVIELTDNKMPVYIGYEEIQMQLQDGEIQISDSDRYIRLAAEDYITDKDKEQREAVWSVVKPLVEKEPDIYDRALRGEMVLTACRESGLTKMSIYRYIKRYWQRGKSKNALLSQFQNCGRKGKDYVNQKKTGRPRIYENAVGRNTDDEIKQIFDKAVKKYYHTQREYSFKTAYELMLKDYYTTQVKQPDGTIRNVLSDENAIPTLRQFRYWYSKTYSIQEKLITRKGEKEFNLKHRAILGKSGPGIRGPGSQYQIDSTIGDIYLVSQFNRANIVGRPIIYFIIDVFSRMVAGMYIGLEGPSWIGTMMALANAATDKVTYCAGYGITIAADEWPCRHIPDTILADRGELEGKSVETLINALNVRVDNTPSFRADMKGVVEKLFSSMDIKTTAFLPGHVKADMKQRGGKDYRLDAQMDIRQFTRIMIKSILNHNNEHFLESYERNENMIADNVEPIPVKLWDWGIAHCSGALRSVSEDTVKLYLMPSDTALVTAKGIRFKGLNYLSERAVYEHWFETARAKGSYKVDISYDPRDLSHIYVRNVNGALYEQSHLADWEAKWFGKSLDEVTRQQAAERALQARNKTRSLQSRIDLNTEIENVIREAEQMAKQTAFPNSKKERISDIRQNRAEEKESIRNNEAFILNKDEKPATGQAVQSTKKSEKTIHPITALIKKKAEEALNDK